MGWRVLGGVRDGGGGCLWLAKVGSLDAGWGGGAGGCSTFERAGDAGSAFNDIQLGQWRQPRPT